MYEQDLALNSLQWLICHKTNQTKSYIFKEELVLNNHQTKSIGHQTKPKPIGHQTKSNQIIYI